jgi:hypothetical protein
MTIYLKNERKGQVRELDTRSEAESVKSDLIGLGVNPEDLTITTDDPREEATDGGETDTADVDVVDHTEAEEPATTESEPDTSDLQQVQDKDIGTDPLSVMPGHFVDQIQGVPTINRKGYAVLAEHFGISVKAEPVTLPSETDFEYAEFKATATTEDGKEYTGFGSAHVERGDGDDPYLLAELAETRALKRAAAWATGVGITAYQELKGDLE